MKYYKKIVGEKVYLSPINPDDAEIMMEWINDEKIGIYMTFLPQIIPLSEEKEILENLSKDNNNLCIVDKKLDKVIGTCGFFNVNNQHRRASMGIMIGDKDYHNKGYGTDALKCLLDYGFIVRNFNNISLEVFEFNKRAIKVYEKVGFKRIGIFREALIYGDRKCNEILMDILASEYETNYLDKYFE